MSAPSDLLCQYGQRPAGTSPPKWRPSSWSPHEGSVPSTTTTTTGSESAFLRDARRRGDSRVCMRTPGNPADTTGRRRVAATAAAAAVVHGLFLLRHACMARYGLIIRRLFERQQVVHPVPCYGKRDSHPEPPIAHSLRFNCLIINLQPVPRLFMLGGYGRFCRVVTLDGINYHNDNGNNGCNDISPSPDVVVVVVCAGALSTCLPPTGRDAVAFTGARVLKCVFGRFPVLGVLRNSSASRTGWDCQMAGKPRGRALQSGGLCRAAGPHPPGGADCGTMQHVGQRRTTHKSPSTVCAL